jgi:hypothetical protein
MSSFGSFLMPWAGIYLGSLMPLAPYAFFAGIVALSLLFIICVNFEK